MKQNYIYLLTVLSLLFFTPSTFSQVAFHNKYKTAHYLDFSMTLSGPNGYYMMGGMSVSGPFNIDHAGITYMNQFGNLLWTKSYDTQLELIVYSRCFAKDGSIVLVGEIAGNPGIDGDGFVLKVDTAGNFLWSTAIGNAGEDWLVSVCPTNDNGLVVTGSTYEPGNLTEKTYLIKLDSAGNKIWSKAFGDSISYHISSVRPTLDNGFILSGEFGSPYSMVLIKTDSAGIPQWRKNYDGISEDWAFTAIQTVDSGYIVYGATGDGAYPTLIKTNQNGDALWAKTYMGPVSTLIDYRNFDVANDGNYVFNGLLLDSSFNSLPFFCKTDLSGNVMWTHIYDTTGNYSAGTAFSETQDGSFIMSAFYAPDSALHFLKTKDTISCTYITQSIFAHPVSLTSDTGINYIIPLDTTWHPIFASTPLTLIEDTICQIFAGGVSVPFVQLETDFSVYPNPFNSHVNISTKDEKRKHIKIFNNFSQLVYSEISEKREVTIFTNDWKAGVYYCTIYVDDQIISRPLYLIK